MVRFVSVIARKPADDLVVELVCPGAQRSISTFSLLRTLSVVLLLLVPPRACLARVMQEPLLRSVG
jgi:hypothetical protein